ncbi:MAG: TolC family protein [Gammaproteobacteria bacterium]|nr:TolC family protein [Gammaproteobacteria bacterium]MBU0847974.1 TolC family protein [Gammaproteobacteria bacterium]MBU1268906.1 TolC family protein [Gammaproteobacteria bacterium]MBU1529760.1 TolC family protein [Gammaproteobacteria bacterium]MBU1779989.1 TolC family protein [Gammaproteobacteria bacterium]
MNLVKLASTPSRGAFFYTLFDKRLMAALLFMAVQIKGVALATTPLDAYLNDAMANNPALAQASFEVEAERQRLENLRARFYPSLALQARASVAEGGRTIDFPAGDLLNPVYSALNAQAMANGQPAQFPTVQNQSIPLLRPTEQDTRLIVRGPIYEPVLDQQVLAQTQAMNAQEAARQQVKEELVRDLKTAYWQLAQARAREKILQASVRTLQENERVNAVLYKAGETTLDAPKRAEAETLEIQVALREASTRALLAQEYFNLLRYAPNHGDVVLPDEELTPQKIGTLLDELKPNTQGSTPAPAITRLERSLAAQRAQLDASRAAYKPTVGYSIEGGYQGRDYSTGPNTGFASASVVLNWTLADAGIRSSEVARSQAQVQALEARARQVNRQLQLAKLQARENLLVSLDNIQARISQRAAAEESLRINERKRNAGETTQVEFLSAEQTATRASLGLATAVYQARIDHAVWQYNNRNIPEPGPQEGAQP